MAIGTIGYGSVISSSPVAETPTWTAFVGVTAITVPNDESATVESTHLASPNRRREYVAGLVDGGECSVTQRYEKAEYARVLALKGVEKMYKIAFPDTSVVAFNGILQRTETSIGLEDVVDVTSTIRTTGNIVFTPAA